MASDKVNKVKDQTVMDRAPAAKTKSAFREYAEAIIMALILALFIRTFIVQAFKIPSGSMIPTLEIGDHILVNKLTYGVRIPFLERYLLQYATPQRGDVVVFIYPEDRSKDFIKRVIAVGGDTVEIRAKKVFINGKPADPSSRRPQLWDMFVQGCEIRVSIASGSERRFLSLPTDRDSLATARGTDLECKMRNVEELFFHIPHFLFTALA